MDSVEEKLAEMEWPFVDSDPAALEELTRRVADAGRGRCLVTYSDRRGRFFASALSKSTRLIG